MKCKGFEPSIIQDDNKYVDLNTIVWNTGFSFKSKTLKIYYSKQELETERILHIYVVKIIYFNKMIV